MACPLESYKNSVSPLRVTLILTVPHLLLKRAGICSLSSRTGNTSTYIPASSTLLILLQCLRFPRYIYTMIRVAALCRTSSSPLLKINTPIISPKLTSSNTNCDMILILVNRHTFNCSGNAPTLFFQMHVATYRETAWNCISLGVVIHHEWATNIVCNAAKPQEYDSSSVL